MSTIGTTSSGPARKGTLTSPSAAIRWARADSGDGVLGATDTTRVPRIPTVHVMAALAPLAGTSLACADGAYAPTPVAGEPASATPIAHWKIELSAKAQQGGAEVSSAGFSTEGWYPVSGRATVMAGLLENGAYENVLYR